METNKLKNYLQAILDMEKELIVLSNTISNLENNIAQSKNPYNEPQKPSEPSISKTTIRTQMPRDLLSWFLDWFFHDAGCGVRIILGIVIWEVGVLLAGCCTSIFIGIIAVIIVRFVICLSIAIYRKNRWHKNAIKAYPKRMEQYKKDMEIYEKNMEQYKHDNENYNAYIQRLKKKLRDLKETYRRIKEMCDKYYQLNIIPKEYWNIVPVSMFYQYIKNGRTYSLTRNPNTSDIGAINMYEEEKDRKIIITRLSQMNDSIRNYQSILYETIQESNSQTERLASEINSMNNNIAEGNRYAALNAYNSQRLVELQQRENDILYYGY